MLNYSIIPDTSRHSTHTVVPLEEGLYHMRELLPVQFVLQSNSELRLGGNILPGVAEHDDIGRPAFWRRMGGILCVPGMGFVQFYSVGQVGLPFTTHPPSLTIPFAKRTLLTVALPILRRRKCDHFPHCYTYRTLFNRRAAPTTELVIPVVTFYGGDTTTD